MKSTALGALAAAAIAMFAPGCAITSMEARIAPNLELVDEDVGKGRIVGVSVADERPTSDIGRRAIGGAKIRMSDDLAAIYQSALVRGLRQKGFDARSGAVAGAPQMKVEIRSLSYDVSTGWWTGGIETDSAIKVVAIGAAESYERIYRASDDDRIVIVPGAKTNNRKLNLIVSSTLRQAVEDRKLLELFRDAPPSP